MNIACLILLAINCVVTMATNPGLKLQLSQSGLNYAASVAIDQLVTEVRGKSIPDQHGSDHVAIGKIDYDITGLSITSFTPPSSSIVVNPGSGVTWSLTNAGVKVHGDWRYKYRKAFIKISDHGSFDVNVRGVSLRVTITLGVDAEGRPTIATTSCNCDVGDVDVKFHGGASWLYNLFKHSVEKPITSKIRSLLCDSVNKAINVDAKNALAKMKVQVPIEGIITLDYRLVAPPVFGKGYVESPHKGEFFWTAQKTEAPFTAQPMPEVSAKQKMVTFYLSDYVSNSLGYVLYKYASMFMQYKLTKHDLPPSAQHYLNTSTIPPLAKKYPNGSIELHLRMTGPPKLQTTKDLIQGHLRGQMDFKVRLPNETLVEGFVVDVRVNASLTATLTGDKITAKVKQLKFHAHTNKTDVGPIPPPLIQLMLNVAAENFIIPQLNEVGQKGFKLPGIDHVQFVDPQLYLMQGAICLTTNARYDKNLRFHPKSML